MRQNTYLILKPPRHISKKTNSNYLPKIAYTLRRVQTGDISPRWVLVSTNEISIVPIHPSTHPTCLSFTRPPPSPNPSPTTLDPVSSLGFSRCIETHARNLCSQHNVTGALTLVVLDAVWNLIPANFANPTGVAVGDSPQYRAHPKLDMPAGHANTAVVPIYRTESVKHTDFSKTSMNFNIALLASIGEVNTNHLKTVFPSLKTYMLTPRKIVDTVRAKHGVATSNDVTKLREPLSRALTSFSCLPGHMDSFLLASQRLTRSGQGETDYRYFELLFLEIVAGFPSVPSSMAGYYAQYPAILQQRLATLFPSHLVESLGQDSSVVFGSHGFFYQGSHQSHTTHFDNLDFLF